MTRYPLMIHECSHLRMVVRLIPDGPWTHVSSDGVVGAECHAGTYLYQAERPRNSHALANCLPDPRP